MRSEVLWTTSAFMIGKICGMGVFVQTLLAVLFSALDYMESFPSLRASERCRSTAAAGQMQPIRLGAR